MLALSLVPLGLTGCAGFFFGEGTKTTLVSSATNATYGTTVTLTGTVAPSDSGALESLGTPAGTVDFYDGTTDLGSETLSSGSASITESALSVGSHTISAVYTPSGSYAASTSASKAVTIVSSLTTTTTTLASSATSTTYGSAVTLSAAVIPTAATGTIYFYTGSTLVGSVAATNGAASLTTTALPLGTDSVTAAYSGDSTYAASTSSAVSIVVSN